jgi:azurin
MGKIHIYKSGIGASQPLTLFFAFVTLIVLTLVGSFSQIAVREMWDSSVGAGAPKYRPHISLPLISIRDLPEPYCDVTTPEIWVGCSLHHALPSPQILPAHASESVDLSKRTVETTLNISTDGDNLAFNQKTLSVKSGSVVELTFENNAKTALMPHNWVLAKPGSEAAVAAAAVQAGQAAGWFSETQDVLAHTKLVNPGERVTVRFLAPPAGRYPYFCSFPGHYTVMKGILVSK